MDNLSYSHKYSFYGLIFLCDKPDGVNSDSGLKPILPRYLVHALKLLMVRLLICCHQRAETLMKTHLICSSIKILNLSYMVTVSWSKQRWSLAKWRKFPISKVYKSYFLFFCTNEHIHIYLVLYRRNNLATWRKQSSNLRNFSLCNKLCIFLCYIVFIQIVTRVFEDS